MLAIRGAFAPFVPVPSPPPPGGPGPFSLSDPDVVRSTLATAWDDVRLEPVEEPFFAGRNAEEAHAFLGGSPLVGGMLAAIDAATRARALDALRRTLADHEQPNGVLFGSAAWLVTARARG